MKRGTKVWVIIAAVLFLIGATIIVGDLIMVKFDFSKLATIRYETNTYEIKETFTNISIQTETGDIVFLPSDSETAKVVCTEDEKLKHMIAVQDGKLMIEVQDARKWYEHIGITFQGQEKVTIYLPDKEYSSLVMEGSTGDVKIKKAFFETLDISATTGHVQLEKITCESMNAKVSTGDITMKNVIANKSMALRTSTGDVKFEQCDAPEISIKVSTGDVKGSVLTEKIFIAKTSTGKIKVPKSVTGGRCEITTSTGDIEINYY